MLFFTSYYYLFLSPHAVALMRLCRSLNPAAGCQLVWHWLIRFPVSGSVAGPARDCAWSGCFKLSDYRYTIRTLSRGQGDG